MAFLRHTRYCGEDTAGYNVCENPKIKLGRIAKEELERLEPPVSEVCLAIFSFAY
eukprot:CAMPEP_0182843632 /NCGR_PEP_ID=MMETSP0006_2-20121128/26298_1 /TAXON_ID=97485 /ORGANISM="Prymnesium parvum, Strain Texoma1" /LENGTH=54 /DNA_ID=CAMNT_0024973451 /DNA_START=286 /DNA_END=450 /DNA_ORIENTATION=+